uniref:RNA-directed RNA polymerase n=1 Tax=Picornavirales sp. TaxID=1955153 RepID=A0A6M9Z7E0_9VIRU|nr:MAG: hypothetical protein 1 [Picornavirales sp.]
MGSQTSKHSEGGSSRVCLDCNPHGNTGPPDPRLSPDNLESGLAIVAGLLSKLKPVNVTSLLTELYYCSDWKDATAIVVRILELYDLLWITPSMITGGLDALVALFVSISPYAVSGEKGPPKMETNADSSSHTTPREAADFEFRDQGVLITDQLKYDRFVKFFENLGLKEVAANLPNLSKVGSFVVTLGSLILAMVFGTDMFENKQKKMANTINQLGQTFRSLTFIDLGWNKLSGLVSDFMCKVLGCASIDEDNPVAVALIKQALELEQRIKDLEVRMMLDPAEMILDQQVMAKIREESKRLCDLVTKFSVQKQNLGNAKVVINRLELKLKELWKLECDLISSYCSKMEPITIWLHGDYGVGKSRLVAYIVAELGRLMGIDLTVYYRNPLEEFWSGYVGQHVTVYDDVGNVVEEKDLIELINIYTNATYQLPMADLSEKGRIFSSQILILCSNHRDIDKSTTMRGLIATQRRRDFLVEVTNTAVATYKTTHGKPPPEDHKLWKADFTHLTLKTEGPEKKYRDKFKSEKLTPNDLIRRMHELWVLRRAAFKQHVETIKARLVASGVVNQAISKCKIVQISGPTGIGKTTLLQEIRKILPSATYMSGADLLAMKDNNPCGVVLLDDVSVSPEIAERFRTFAVAAYDNPSRQECIIYTCNPELMTFNSSQQRMELSRRISERWDFSWKTKHFVMTYDHNDLKKRPDDFEKLVRIRSGDPDSDYLQWPVFTFAEAVKAISSLPDPIVMDDVLVARMLTIGQVIPDFSFSLNGSIDEFEEAVGGAKTVKKLISSYSKFKSLCDISLLDMQKHASLLTKLTALITDTGGRKFRTWTELFNFLATSRPAIDMEEVVKIMTPEGDFVIGTDSKKLVVFKVDERIAQPLHTELTADMERIYKMQKSYVEKTGTFLEEMRGTITLTSRWNDLPELLKGLLCLGTYAASWSVAVFAGIYNYRRIAASAAGLDIIRSALKNGLLIDGVYDEAQKLPYEYRHFDEEQDDPSKHTRKPNVAPGRTGRRDMRPEQDDRSELTRKATRAPKTATRSMQRETDDKLHTRVKDSKAPVKHPPRQMQLETTKLDLRRLFSPSQALSVTIDRLPEQPEEEEQDFHLQMAEFEPQQTLDQNALELSRLVGKNLVQIANKNGVHIVWGLMIEGHVGVTVNHAFAPGYLDRGHFTCRDLKGNQYFGSTIGSDTTRDVAVFRLSKISRMFPSILRHLPLAQNCKPVDGCAAIMLIAERKITPDFHLVHVKHLVLETLKTAPGENNGYLFSGATEIMKSVSPVGTVGGDCGSPLILTNVDHMYKLVGIHKRASVGQGFAADIYQEDFHDFLMKRQTNPRLHFLKWEKVTMFPEPEQIGNVEYVGEAEPPNYQTTKTSYWRSPLSPPFIPICHEPTVLSNQDARIPEDFLEDIRYASLKKWTTPLIQNFDRELMLEAMEEIIEHRQGLALASGKRVKVLTKTEAINRCSEFDVSNPINRASSAGYCWKNMVKTPGKHEFFKFDAENGIHRINMETDCGQKLNHAIDEMINHCRRGEQIGVIFQTALKDEVRPIHRVRKTPETRAFTPAPIHYLIMHRMYFHGAIALLRELRHSTSVKIGIDPMSAEWDFMVRKCLSYNTKGCAGDFHHFDGEVHPAVCAFPSAVYRSIYYVCDPQCTPEDDLIRQEIARADSKPVIQLNTELVQFKKGVHSGKPSTGDDDSLINEFYLLYSWKVLCKKLKHPRKMRAMSQWLANVCAILFGDDNEFHPREEVIGWYNLRTVAEVLKEHLGVILLNSDKTTELKEYSHFLELEFLKRHHRLIGDRFVGVYTYKTFSKALHWMNTGPRHYYDRDEGQFCFKPESVVNTAHWALREAVLVGGEFFSELYAHFAKVFSQFQLPNNLPTLTSLCIEFGLPVTIVRGLKHPEMQHIFEVVEESTQVANVVRVHRGTFYHYGVQVGLDVYHLNSDEDVLLTGEFSGFTEMKVSSVAEFRTDGVLEVCNLMADKFKPLPYPKILQQIELYEGEVIPFDIFQFNCEHFAHLLVYGISYSFQISDFYKPILKAAFF